MLRSSSSKFFESRMRPKSPMELPSRYSPTATWPKAARPSSMACWASMAAAAVSSILVCSSATSAVSCSYSLLIWAMAGFGLVQRGLRRIHGSLSGRRQDRPQPEPRRCRRGRRRATGRERPSSLFLFRTLAVPRFPFRSAITPQLSPGEHADRCAASLHLPQIDRPRQASYRKRHESSTPCPWSITLFDHNANTCSYYYCNLFGVPLYCAKSKRKERPCTPW